MKKQYTSKYSQLGAIALVVTAATFLSACGGVIDAGDSTSSDSTIELEVATFAPPNSVSEVVPEVFFDEVTKRSDGRIVFNVSDPETVCPAAEIASCVQDGRVDLGISVPDYSPQLFPTVSLVSVPFLVNDAQALMQGLYESNTTHEGAVQYWDDVGLHPISHFSPGRLLLGTHDPIDSIEGISDKRWRTAGKYLQQAVEVAGGSNISLTSPETYEGIQRGVADAVGGPMDGATHFRHMELLPHWSDPGSGHYTTVGLWMNQATYQGLSDDLKKIVDDVTLELNSGLGIEAFAKVAAEQCEQLASHAESITRWPEAGTNEWQSAVGDNLLDQWIQDSSEFGLQDAEGYSDMFATFLENHTSTAEDPMDTCLDAQG